MSDHKHAGHLQQWVSGPRRSTEQILDEDGLLGSFTLVLYWKPNEETGDIYWVDFELFEITALVGKDKRPEYSKRGASDGVTTTANLDEAESAAHGMVKWDGCTQFEVSPVHIDSKGELERLCMALEEARRRCALAMGDTYDRRSEYP